MSKKEENTQYNELEVGQCCFCGDECNPLSQSCGTCARSMTMYGFSSKTGRSDFFYDRDRKTVKVCESSDKKDFIVRIDGQLWVGDPYDIDVNWEIEGYNGLVMCQDDDDDEKSWPMYILNAKEGCEYIVCDYGEKIGSIIHMGTIVFIPKSKVKLLDKDMKCGVYIRPEGNGILDEKEVRWKRCGVLVKD